MKKNQEKKQSITKYIILSLWGLFIVGVVGISSLFFLIAHGKIGYMPPIEELENPKNKFASEIYSSDGKVLGRYYQEKENRVFVNYSELSPSLVKALIATEDVRFTQHSGIDVKALFRVFFKRIILMQHNAGGGSTITQQLAKMLFSPGADNLAERFFQKPIEWVIAVQLERFYTKEEIINMYLNKYDFGNQAVGIKTAARTYFDKSPGELSVEEAATLIGMCKNSSLYNPVRRNEKTRDRRNVVLSQMEKAEYLTESQRDSLQALPLRLKFNRIDHKDGLAPYFREHLRMMMTAKKPERKNYASWQTQKYRDDSLAWETNPLFGWCNKNTKSDGSKYNLYTDGLKIYATIDSRMQRYAEEAVVEHIGGALQPKFSREKMGRSYAPFSRNVSQEEIEGILNRSMRQSERYITMRRAGASAEEIKTAFNTPTDMRLFSWHGTIDTTMTPLDSIRYQKHFLRTGFLSMDPRTGYVKAYVGGINFNNFQYDMVTEGRRQVGSTIKPFLYTLAMQEGFSPDDLAPNVQPHYVDESGNTWSPRNASKARIGEMVTLRWGLINSNNWISAYLMNQLSPYAFVRLLHSFGIRNQLDPVMSLCLGAADVSVEEMVTAYSSFANNGIRSEPIFVTRIEDNFGNVISTFSPALTEVFSEETNTKMLPILQGVINEGTGTRLRFRYGIKAEMGGKTGTTNNNSDGWFMGFTPSLVSGVWVGGEDRSVHFDNIADGQGANMALPIYGLFMQKVYADPSLGYNQEEKFSFGNTHTFSSEEESSSEEILPEPKTSVPAKREAHNMEGIFD